MTAQLYPDISVVAARHPRSDRLILRRLLDKAARDKHLADDASKAAIEAAHEILIRWADLESSGRLADIQETQMQGDFLREVFGDALGYKRQLEGDDRWQLEQHWTIPGNGTPDGIIGAFRQSENRRPTAVVELKGPKVHLDRDRSQGRTAVQQCWDYLANLPECRWGIVSNMVSFRLYERGHSPRRYEHFALQDLRDPKEFRRFYVLFERNGLLKPPVGPPRALDLLIQTDNRQRDVGDELYDRYSENRKALIAHLHFEKHFALERAIAVAQQLIDRIVFIAFCEDRGLLPDRTLEKAWSELPPFTKATNPKWQSFLQLFRAVDTGGTQSIPDGYNGNLFKTSLVDELDLDDNWTSFFKEVGGYDFRDEINLDVLGHLFEKSITELEKLREGDFFARTSELTGAPNLGERPTMPQSALRKRMGIYYTPPQFTAKIVELAVGELITSRFGDVARRLKLDPLTADTLKYWSGCLDILRALRVVDPACGSGAFLFQAYELLEQRYGEVIDHLDRHDHPDAKRLEEAIPAMILGENLYGVDLSPEAVEITQLALWIRSARRGKTLADLSHNIRHGNSLVHDASIDSHGFDWHEAFPEVFGTGRDAETSRDREGADHKEPLTDARGSSEREPGFDCVIGNPPWERIKLQEREFFSISAPEIATATNAAKRRRLIAKLPDENPELHARYVEAQQRASTMLEYCRKSKEYPLTGKGDINTYAVFAELSLRIVGPRGRVGILVPSGIASDMTTKDFFVMLMNNKRLIALYDFHNRRKLFVDVEGRLKFCILLFEGADGTSPAADFIFFAEQMEDVDDANRHVTLSADDMSLVNPNTRTCPIFRTKRDAEITRAIYRRVPILIDHNREHGGNPWGISFKRMFDQTNDAELFREVGWFLKKRYTMQGNRWVKPPSPSGRGAGGEGHDQSAYLPLYEAKMCRPYDHRHGTAYTDESSWYLQGRTTLTSLVQHQNPEFVVLPRYWVDAREVSQKLGNWTHSFLLGFRDIVRATDERTMIAHFIPRAGAINTLPLIFPPVDTSPVLPTCLIANLNAIPLDFVARQKIPQVHMNFFVLEQLPVFPPHSYDRPCPWDEKTTLVDWISERVLKLTCSAEDMLPLAEACDFTAGNLDDYGGRLHRWDPAERAQIMAELDAAYFILYGIDREDAAYILSTFSGVFDAQPTLPSARSQGDLILDTFDWLSAHASP